VDELGKKTGLDILIHVDGVSDMFITPFVYPMYKWAFDVKHVHSINTSGHKFGASVAFAISIGLIFDVQLILQVCRSGVWAGFCGRTS
jgi:glutamate/tyrosine decarboxylase-like PLP-dependent enzyme